MTRSIVTYTNYAYRRQTPCNLWCVKLWDYWHEIVVRYTELRDKCDKSPDSLPAIAVVLRVWFIVITRQCYSAAKRETHTSVSFIQYAQNLGVERFLSVSWAKLLNGTRRTILAISLTYYKIDIFLCDLLR